MCISENHYQIDIVIVQIYSMTNVVFQSVFISNVSTTSVNKPDDVPVAVTEVTIVAEKAKYH